MTKEEILKFLKDNNAFKDNNHLSSKITPFIKKNHPEIISEMKKVTGINDDNISRLIWHIINGNEIPKCPICGNILEFKNYGEGYKKGCSKECLDKLRGRSNLGKSLSEETKQKMKNTYLSRYGVDNPSKLKEIRDKIKRTNLEKYGVERPAQNEAVKEKTKQTNLGRYGVSAPLKNQDILKKMKATNLERYGSISSMSNKEVQEKRRQTNLERYGTEWATSSDIVKERAGLHRMKSFYDKLFTSSRLGGATPLFKWEEYEGNKRTLYKFKCNTCGTEFENKLENGRIPICPTCHPKVIGISEEEKDLLKFISSIYSGTIIENDRKTIYPYELDIYLPEKKLAFEYDGLYWHSSQFKDKYYHLNKTSECESKGIRLIHIFSDEWYNKKPIVQSIIKASLNIYDRKIGARKCEIRELSINEASNFLEGNHLQGYSTSNIRLGLFYREELVSVLTFQKPRFNKSYNWELVRYANKLNTLVIGGFSKLLTYFRKRYKGTIITYSDRRLFMGNLYRENGFKELPPTEPNYFYLVEGVRRSRINYQKYKIIEGHPEYKNLTEKEIMSLLGYYRIYDCGNWKFEIEKEDD